MKSLAHVAKARWRERYHQFLSCIRRWWRTSPHRGRGVGPPAPTETYPPPTPRFGSQARPRAHLDDAVRDLQVLRPRVLQVNRKNPLYIAIGDEAEVTRDAGLMLFLMSSDASGTRLDEGLCTEWTASASIGSTAAYVAVCPRTLSEDAWSGVRMTVQWIRPVRPGEALRAEARVESIRKTSVTISYRTWSADSEEVIATGDVVLVYNPEGQPVPLDALRAPADSSRDTAQDISSTSLPGLTSGRARPFPPRRILYVLMDDEMAWSAELKAAWLQATRVLDSVADRYHARWTHVLPCLPRWAQALNLTAYAHEYTSIPVLSSIFGDSFQDVEALLVGRDEAAGTRPVGDAWIWVAPVRLDDAPLEAVHTWIEESIVGDEASDFVVLVIRARATTMTLPTNIDKLENHLRYIRLRHPYIECSTLSKALRCHADARVEGPRSVGMRRPEVLENPPRLRWTIPIPGPLEPRPDVGPQKVQVSIPSYIELKSIRRVAVLEKGTPILEKSWDMESIEFSVEAPGDYVLEVEMDPSWYEEIRESLVQWLGEGYSKYLLRPDARTGETKVLFTLRRPYRLMESVADAGRPSPGDTWIWKFPPDLLRLLTHPLAGGKEPLGRGFHPYGICLIGAALYATAHAYGGSYKPLQADIRFYRFWTGRHDLTLRARVAAADDCTLITEHELFEGTSRVAQVRLTSIRESSAARPSPRPTPSIQENLHPAIVAPASASIDLEAIDLYEAIRKLNPAYIQIVDEAGPFLARIQRLSYAPTERRLYIIFGEGYVFFSDDDLQTLQEVREINYLKDSELVPFGLQSVDAVVETVDGTVLFMGRDRRAQAGEVGVVWRKPRGEPSFTRHEVCRPAWATSKTSCATAGFLGSRHTRAVALTVYGTEDAHFYYSLDDGLTWRRQSMASYFRHHVHEVYLPRSVPHNRKARLWVTGGDDPSGEQSGVLCFEDHDDEGALVGPIWVLRETPGYRLVGLTGNGKYVFIGNESLAGGVLKIQDNIESIENGHVEYVLGKVRHEYHQFGALIATPDGILVSGTSNYAIYAGDTVRGDSGGSVFVSNDEGATFIEIPLGARWVTSMTYDGRWFWLSASATREYGPDVSRDRLTVWRLRKPSPYQRLVSPYVAKVLLLDSSEFYQFAGYSVHPQPVLMPGARTFRVDLSAYRSIGVDVETLDPATLVVEACPFDNWRLGANPWYDALVLVLDAPGRYRYTLPETASHNRHFRIRNDSPHPVRIRMLAFTGKS